MVMPLKFEGTIELSDSEKTLFDHGAFDPKTRRVFVAHTAQDRVEVIDHDRAVRLQTLAGFAHAAGVVADEGEVLVTNRGASSLSWVDAAELSTKAVFETAPRPNGVAIVARRKLGIAACIGDENRGPELHAIELQSGRRWSIRLPGRPRWCVTDGAGERVYLAIREPSMILVAKLPQLEPVQHWPLPSSGAHGLDIDTEKEFLYAACDGAMLVQVDAKTGKVHSQWPLAGGPDATFFNPKSALVHVAIGEPGVVQTIDPRSGARSDFVTAKGAQTTALALPDRLYVFSPAHRGAIVLSGA
jgi:DNA-binding beta-propeller fold protein YncE